MLKGIHLLLAAVGVSGLSTFSLAYGDECTDLKGELNSMVGIYNATTIAEEGRLRLLKESGPSCAPDYPLFADDLTKAVPRLESYRTRLDKLAKTSPIDVSGLAAQKQSFDRPDIDVGGVGILSYKITYQAGLGPIHFPMKVSIDQALTHEYTPAKNSPNKTSCVGALGNYQAFAASLHSLDQQMQNIIALGSQINSTCHLDRPSIASDQNAGSAASSDRETTSERPLVNALD